MNEQKKVHIEAVKKYQEDDLDKVRKEYIVNLNTKVMKKHNVNGTRD